MIIRLADGTSMEVALESRHQKIGEIRLKVAERLECPPDDVRMIGMGKMLKDSNDDGDLTFMDYGINKDFTLIASKMPKIDPVVEPIEPDVENEERKEEAPMEGAEGGQVINGVVIPPDPQEGLPSDADRCPACVKNPKRKCTNCNCSVCGINKDPELTLGCDECSFWFHTYCCDPVVEQMPPDGEDWFCSNCKLDEKEVLGKDSDKASTSKRASKDALWKKQTKGPGDRGNANASVDKSSLLPTHHIGKVPGVPVGSCWTYRTQVSAAAIHRPPVSGMHGSQKTHAYSIVSSHGYEDDDDKGDILMYTGAGGRGDLGEGNRRTGNQVDGQKLNLTNLALAKNCSAFNEKTKENGVDAGDNWKKGKPVRVVRGVKNLKKRGQFCPQYCGFRYDGIYKVKRYYSEEGMGGHTVWKFELRRDDSEPAPWTKEGKKRIQELGLFLQPTEHKENKNEKIDEEPTKKKRKVEEIKQEPPPKIPKFEMPEKVQKLMAQDSERNQKKWKEIFEGERGYEAVVKEIKESFKCPVCFDLLIQPVSFQCGDSLCFHCLQKMIKMNKAEEKKMDLKCQVCHQAIPNSTNTSQVNEVLLDCIDAVMEGWKQINWKRV